MKYPETRVVDHRDDYHGTEVADPYRWLEEIESKEVQDWVRRQNELTEGVLDGIPERKEFLEELRRAVDYTRYGTPERRGESLFTMRHEGLSRQPRLVRSGEDPKIGEVVLDPNTFSEDGTVSMPAYSITPSGRLVAYAKAGAGSDWLTWHVRDLESGEDLPDVIEWSKFGVAMWDAEEKGFYYSRFPKPEPGAEYKSTNERPQLCYHKLGSEPGLDQVVYEDLEHPQRLFFSSINADRTLIGIHVRERGVSTNRLVILNLGNGETTELLSGHQASMRMVDAFDDSVLLETDLDAPRGRVLRVRLRAPDMFEEVVPQHRYALNTVDCVAGRLFCSYLRNACSLVHEYDLHGEKVGEIRMGLGSISGFTGDRHSQDTFYTYTDFVTPATSFRYEPEINKRQIVVEDDADFDSANFEVAQEFVESKDGTSVPVFLITPKGCIPNGENPTILYGYGGFRVPQRPAFSALRTAWLKKGGIYVVACLRGGLEYGEEWHEAGTKLQKQNVFDDYYAVAEWLVEQRFTSARRLGALGRSNGGLLVGAALTQRPELFGAAVPTVGVLDMLRFNKFTIGWAWESDYGSPQDPEEFRALYAYSPYHNVREGESYPATLVVTGDTDDRVVPSHSYKFAARMQAAQGGDAPVLLRVDTSAGHGMGKPIDKQLEETADTYAFFLRHLGGK
ncbi:MAG: prolyl oligopeptidase family serine peptidase [Fimbriimonadaceae bacterium]